MLGWWESRVVKMILLQEGEEKEEVVEVEELRRWNERRLSEVEDVEEEE